MKVVLLTDSKLGAIGQIKDFAMGYVKNYLLPRKLVKIANKNNIESLEKQKAELLIHSTQKKEKALELINVIKDRVLIFVRQASEDGGLYGSVNPKDLAEGLMNEIDQTVFKGDFEIDRTAIVFSPIKFIGLHKAKFLLHGNVYSEHLINVCRSKEEGELALSKHFEKLLEVKSEEKQQ